MSSKADSFDTQQLAAQWGNRPAGHVVSTINTRALEDPRDVGTARETRVRKIQLDRIIAKAQVRKHFDQQELNELAHSLKTVGQQTPILVYWSEEDERYVIIAGERRFRAAQLAELTELTCKIHPSRPEEAELVELQYVENAIRSDLNPIEEAESYKRLQELKGYSANQLAERIGKNQSTISRALSLLKLPNKIQADIVSGKIPARVARDIVRLDGEQAQLEAAEAFLRGELTGRDTEAKARGKREASGPAKLSKKWSQDGITLTVAYGRGVTLNDLAAVLEERAKLLRSDGRGKKAA